MKNKLLIAILLASLTLTACGNDQAKKAEDMSETKVEESAEEKANDENDSSKEEATGEEISNETVKIKDLTGEVEVRKNPKKVVALDNRTFETLEDWRIKLVAAPKPIMAKTSGYIKGDSIGDIGYSAPGFGRVWGPLYQVLGLKPAIEVTNTSKDHKGDDISVEAIAQANPAYLLVLDRDAATTKDGEESTPASDVIGGSEALKNTDPIKNSPINYAPADTYTN